MIRLLVDSLDMQSPGALELQEELVAALARTAPEGASLVVATAQGRTLACADQVDLRVVLATRGGWVGRWWWTRQGLPALVRQESVNVVFKMSGLLSRRLVQTCGVVTTCNNMLPFTPALLRELPASLRFKMTLLKQVFLRGFRLADAAVLHSTHALNLVTAGEPTWRTKTQVVLTGIPRAAWLDGEAAPPVDPWHGRPFFFCLSTMQPYKNHVRLIDAYAAAVARVAPATCPDLIIAGIPADRAYVARVEAAARATGLGEQVRYLGAVDRATIPGWIYHATANLFPSLCETNSVIQAEILGGLGVMACSDIPPMNEVAGEAALVFDPDDTEAMTQVLVRLAGDAGLRHRLREAAHARRRALSWDDCGRTIWAQAGMAHRRFQERTAHG